LAAAIDEAGSELGLSFEGMKGPATAALRGRAQRSAVT